MHVARFFTKRQHLSAQADSDTTLQGLDETGRGITGFGSTGKITTKKNDLLIQSQTLFTIVKLFL